MSCDLLRRNSLFKLQARYVAERQDPGLWAKVLSDDNRYRRQHIDQVGRTLSALTHTLLLQSSAHRPLTPSAWLLHAEALMPCRTGGLYSPAGEQEPRAGVGGGEGFYGSQPPGGAHRAPREDCAADILVFQQPQSAGPLLLLL